ncbi:hypothetical protein LOTGIDRAFT_232957 [Lottia gigantea]|uniref:Chitin-binding type-2 domain-containing protein n=1 Tax=Lottia gigantea TaxID=225164 RepID=V3ZND4_LOTGI|nr:hypothetical protein LOTGIDRAFT_232957 [Lottia gigantea]ESO92883.1 hypothetical protein LOTGIDRAFT_232957 [Lottia gigantea]
MSGLFYGVVLGIIVAVLSAPRERRQAQDPRCAGPTGNFGINCTSFVSCFEGYVFGTFTCGSENGQLKFNPNTGACDWATAVNCEVQPKFEGDQACTQIPPGFEEFAYFVSHPQFCNMYFVCDHGNYRGTRNCNQGQIFSEINGTCIVGGQDMCNKPLLPYENLH